MIVGQTVTLLGNLTDRLGNPIDNTNVDIYLNGTYTVSLFTNSSGWFKASAPVNTPGTYVITIAYNGSDTYNPSSHDEILMVYLTLDTKIEFTLSPNPATVWQTITLAGNLTDQYDNAVNNAPVEVHYSIDNGVTWIYAGTISTDLHGGFRARGKLTLIGYYLIAVVYKGTYTYNPSHHIEILTVTW